MEKGLRALIWKFDSSLIGLNYIVAKWNVIWVIYYGPRVAVGVNLIDRI